MKKKQIKIKKVDIILIISTLIKLYELFQNY